MHTAQFGGDGLIQPSVCVICPLSAAGTSQALEITENMQQVTHLFKFEPERDGAAELLQKAWMDELEVRSSLSRWW